jgi:hypothetical protein
MSILCFIFSQSRVGLVIYHALVSGGKEATDHPPIIGQYPLSLTTIFTVFFLSHLSFSACKSMKNGLGRKFILVLKSRSVFPRKISLENPFTCELVPVINGVENFI